jgi:two-component sensor histidine kinase
MNNLHTVVSLLHLQARSTSDQAREDLLTTAERVNVMAKVPQRLVRSDGADTADVKEFIEGLCNDLRAALIGARPVQLIVRAESLPIPLNKAISVGLIVNELVVNSLKYAFPDKREGGVVVEFTRKGGEYHLRVSDDGIGSGPQSNAAAPPQGSARLGQRLIRSFVAQLSGRIEIENRSPGTTVVVWFPASEQEGIREGNPPA